MTPAMVTSLCCVVMTNVIQKRCLGKTLMSSLTFYQRPSHIVFNIILDGCRVQNEPGEIEAASGPGPYWRQGNRQEEEEGRPQNRHHRRQEAPVQPQEALRCGRFSSGSKLIVFSKASFLLIVLK